MEDNQKQKIMEIIMEDYKILKTYSTISYPSIRYNIISFALATIGIIISGIMLTLASKNLSEIAIQIIIFFMIFFVPAFSITILFIWLGEEERMMRIGRYLLKLEESINQKANDKILNWETFIRRKEEKIKYPELLIIALLFGISFGFSFTGLYIAETSFGKYFTISILSFNIKVSINIIFLIIIYLVLHIIFFLYTIYYIKNRLLK